MLSSFFEVRFFKIRTTYRVGCCAQCSINSLNKISIIKFYLLKKTANIQIYVELNITGRAPSLSLRVGLYADRDVACHVCTSQATQVAGFPLLSLTRGTRVHTRYAHALGMRRVCVAKCAAPKRQRSP